MNSNNPPRRPSRDISFLVTSMKKRFWMCEDGEVEAAFNKAKIQIAPSKDRGRLRQEVIRILKQTQAA